MDQRIIGSHAARIWYPDFPREPKDIDYFWDQKPAKRADGLRVEHFYHPALEQYEGKWQYPKYASPNELYTIKVSHIFWNSARWVKHAKDIIFYQDKGAEFIPELYDLLYPIWVEHYGKKKASLPKGTQAEDFFKSTVKRVYEHDSIHASVASYDEPLFNAVLGEGEAVAVEWSKFEALSDEDKLRLVREEIYATSLERHIIPSDYKMNYVHGYRKALQQTITSFWKGKWALYAALNLRNLVNPELDYVALHKKNSERLIKL